MECDFEQLYNVTLHNVTLYNIILYNVILYHVELYNTVSVYCRLWVSVLLGQWQKRSAWHHVR